MESGWYLYGRYMQSSILWKLFPGSIRLLATMLANYKQTYAAKVKTADEAVAPIKDKEILVVAMSIGQPRTLKGHRGPRSSR
jgi:hypothetical protein